ncbi:hypothetical protein E2562_018217 [Oryza meyeriana var. granulata]|uniref:Uncharacterized protein n=1 Tax=Oryza meyeriana var. granulata TaxID=110450 RepID=A0A6G1CGL7_9ORYZ|nr:hypothetical protein E2562_018217 [Oryza meyeriana var. granulata]
MPMQRTTIIVSIDIGVNNRVMTARIMITTHGMTIVIVTCYRGSTVGHSPRPSIVGDFGNR